MVKQNLPVGAVFEDGGLYFEVQSVLPDGNYISKRIEKQETANEEVPENVPLGTTPEEPEEKSLVEAQNEEAPVEKKVTRNTQRKTTTRGRKK